MPRPPHLNRRTASAVSAGIAALLTAVSIALTVTACGQQQPTQPPAPTTPSTSASTATPEPTESLSRTTTTLTVTPAANNAIGAGNVQDAWRDLSAWILDTGFDPDLIRTPTPTASQLGKLTALMTAACAAAVQADIDAKTPTAIGSIEALTAVGVTAPSAAPVNGDDLVTDRAITDATADTNNGALTITATSAATIHYTGTADPSVRTHAVFERHTVYTMALQDGRWFVDAWDGTYTTSNAVAD